MMPACLMPPPSIFLYFLTLAMKSLGPATMLPIGAPIPCTNWSLQFDDDSLMMNCDLVQQPCQEEGSLQQSWVNVTAHMQARKQVMLEVKPVFVLVCMTSLPVQDCMCATSADKVRLPISNQA